MHSFGRADRLERAALERLVMRRLAWFAMRPEPA
jgi:hypothetical protein